jgi:acyl-CoA synthetase (AMP-forming)/AMP-acid ligase II
VAGGRKSVGGRSIRWDDGRAAAAYDAGLWVRGTLADALRDAATDTPERIVLVDGDTRLDCRGLLARAEALAAALAERMPEGSVVSFMLPNWHEAAVVYLAATLAGMVVNPILPSLREHELRFILDDADTRIIFVPATLRGHDYAAMLERVSTAMGTAPEVVVLRGESGTATAYDDLFGATAGRSLPALDPDAVRMILYTSGTTGRPKGVLHTHNSIHALIQQIGDHWLVAPGDKFLVPSPIAHIGGSIYAFECPLLLGSTAVLMERWDAVEGVGLMVAEGCTHMAGATPFLEQILSAAEREGTQLPDLKVFICGGASVPPSLIRRAAAYFERAMVTRVYGSTEVPVTTVGAPGDAERSADTDGRPGIADIMLVDGEIRARGAQMLVGYLHAEDEAGSFDDGGHFRTGDLGRWDGDCLVVTGRAKDLIIRNGENISPKEVEDILVGHPGIAEVAIVGVPDARTGERACAVIVAASEATGDGTAASEATGDGTAASATGPDVADLREFLEGHGVARFKVPERVVSWDALPKNDAGKVLKHQIRAALLETEE